MNEKEMQELVAKQLDGAMVIRDTPFMVTRDTPFTKHMFHAWPHKIQYDVSFGNQIASPIQHHYTRIVQQLQHKKVQIVLAVIEHHYHLIPSYELFSKRITRIIKAKEDAENGKD